MLTGTGTGTLAGMVNDIWRRIQTHSPDGKRATSSRAMAVAQAERRSHRPRERHFDHFAVTESPTPTPWPGQIHEHAVYIFKGLRKFQFIPMAIEDGLLRNVIKPFDIASCMVCVHLWRPMYALSSQGENIPYCIHDAMSKAVERFFLSNSSSIAKLKKKLP